MKLIIDVDEKLVCKGFEQSFTEEERDILIRAIGNGTPVYEHERLKSEWQETDKLWETNCSGGMGYDYGYYFKCPICNNTVVDKTNFCPNCGADMREAENDI